MTYSDISSRMSDSTDSNSSFGKAFDQLCLADAGGADEQEATRAWRLARRCRRGCAGWPVRTAVDGLVLAHDARACRRVLQLPAAGSYSWARELAGRDLRPSSMIRGEVLRRQRRRSALPFRPVVFPGRAAMLAGCAAWRCAHSPCASCQRSSSVAAARAAMSAFILFTGGRLAGRTCCAGSRPSRPRPKGRWPCRAG